MTDRPTTIDVIGAGGHAKVIVAAAEAAGLEIGSIYDDDATGELGGHRIVGPIPESAETLDHPTVLAIGANDVRRKLAFRLEGAEWAVVVHPAAWVAPDVELGPGTVVFAGAIVQPGTTVGRHVILNTRASVDHDCRLGDFVHVAPGTTLAADVIVGEGAFVATGSAVIPGIAIGAWATVGAGAAVVRDVPEDAVVGGVPARGLR